MFKGTFTVLVQLTHKHQTARTSLEIKEGQYWDCPQFITADIYKKGINVLRKFGFRVKF